MYRLARLSLGHRAVTALVTVAVAILGVLSLGSLKQELIPSVQLPAAAVVAVYPGSSPEVVEDQVSVPLENAVRGVRGVDEVASTSSTNLSVTSVTFDFGTDMDLAAQQLRTAVDRLASSLPEDVQPEVVTGSVDDLPVVQLAVAGSTDAATLATTVQDVLVPRLEEVADVREVSVTGAAEREITLAVELPALVAAGLSPEAVLTVLDDHGITLPAGTVTEGSQAFSVEVGSPVTSLEELAALPLRGEQGTIPLGEVVDVVDGEAARTSLSRLDGAPALAVAITKTPEGNTVDVSHEVQAAVDEASATLDAAQVEVAVVFDQAPFIEESIENLATEGALGLVFAVLVILLFLASLRSTLVSAISIPLSLLVAFTLMQVTGYTLNLLTLSALTVAIGRVVDDSIVVIENIKRHLSYGEAKGEAVLGAVREVGGAITSSTVATVAVFVPIGLVGGFVGELFRPFAMTVAIAMGASLFVALTIVPVLAFWFIRAPHDADEDAAQARRHEAETKERRGVWQRAYVPTLAASLRHPGLTLLVAVVMLGGTLALVPRLETNLLGDSGQDTVTVTQQFEPGTSLEAQDSASRAVEDSLLDMPEVATVQTTVGSDSSTAAFTGGGGQPEATFSLTLAADVDGVVGQDAVRVAVQDLLASPATALTVSGADAAFGSSTVDLVVTAEDLDALTQAAQRTADAAVEVDGALAVTNNLASDQRIVDVTVDRAAAAAAGLTETAVAGAVSSLMSPSSIGSVDLGEGPVTVRAVLGEAPATVAELETVPLSGPQGPVPLAQVASVELIEVPSAITRVDGGRSATVSVTPAGQDIGSLSAELTSVVADLDLPAGAEVTIGGVASDQEEAFADLGLALLLAVIIVYIVMVATFNSLVQPLILLVSVPLASTGALVALLVTGTPLGVPALIGLLMLVGVVVSNAIVLIDLVNQYRARGRSLHEAVTEGARKRLRPVVMTAAATIFALVPMALGVTGGGAFISQPLALVVIGGLISSTALTLLVVPVLYTLYEGRRERGREGRTRTRRAAAEA
ncbi:efflux RND transporter permease subunit [Actinotalea sp. BY-33]|uniref:Efflux RND transporter permease subunit n=1 Tax=Actinotalea soli TaxID=2819234 RepID=A0A939LN94_9CELL|nr:efflux RND transporter permease subunit [Actinotalea soli]MBO1750509.1 efflux RND transporter permease subunit [Actinotalea soli]